MFAIMHLRWNPSSHMSHTRRHGDWQWHHDPLEAAEAAESPAGYWQCLWLKRRPGRGLPSTHLGPGRFSELEVASESTKAPSVSVAPAPALEGHAQWRPRATGTHLLVGGPPFGGAP